MFCTANTTKNTTFLLICLGVEITRFGIKSAKARKMALAHVPATVFWNHEDAKIVCVCSVCSRTELCQELSKTRGICATLLEQEEIKTVVWNRKHAGAFRIVITRTRRSLSTWGGHICRAYRQKLEEFLRFLWLQAVAAGTKTAYHTHKSNTKTYIV